MQIYIEHVIQHGGYKDIAKALCCVKPHKIKSKKMSSVHIKGCILIAHLSTTLYLLFVLHGVDINLTIPTFKFYKPNHNLRLDKKIKKTYSSH